MQKGLELIANKKTEILIVGTFPGEESLRKNQYYANPQNDFWRLIEHGLNENLVNLEYSKKIKKLLDNKIGLWDIYCECERKGSADSRIKKYFLNNFESLPDKIPKLSLICFNGKSSSRCYNTFEKLGYETIILPSSSGANRRNNGKRFAYWKNIIKK